MKGAELGASQGIDVAMWGHLIIVQMQSCGHMVVGGGMSFASSHEKTLKEIVVLRGDVMRLSPGLLDTHIHPPYSGPTYAPCHLLPCHQEPSRLSHRHTCHGTWFPSQPLAPVPTSYDHIAGTHNQPA